MCTIFFINFYEFPLAASASETTKNTVDKVQKERSKKRKGKGQITNARQSYQAEGGIFFLCFFLCSHPVFNVMLIYSKPCKMNDSFSSLNTFAYEFKTDFLIELLIL
jgi:hypothetical protein